LRVLHVGKYYPPFAGGMENFLADLLGALRERGIDARGLVHDHSGRRSKRLERGDPPQEDYVRRVPSYGTLLYAPLSPGFPSALRRQIRNFRPDLLHLHLPNTSAFWVLAIGCAKQVKWVIHWHSDVVPSNIDGRLSTAYRLYRPFEQAVLKRATSVVATSDRYLASSEPLSRWRHKCGVIPLGLDPKRFRRPAAADVLWAEVLWGSEKHRVLSVGRLTYYKGHEILIRAAASLENTRILVVGEGHLGGRLREQADSMGLRDRVRFLGSVTESEIRSLLSTCDCLCLPSIERTEAFGLVLLEAMVFAKPVVASDIPGSGVGWVVKHGETGWLVDPDNHDALSVALKRLLEKPNMLEGMGEAGRKRFESFFQIDAVASAVTRLYGSCLKQSVTSDGIAQRP
jgi:glycosyltransferase involved in cell wall biosynthesis